MNNNYYLLHDGTKGRREILLSNEWLHLNSNHMINNWDLILIQKYTKHYKNKSQIREFMQLVVERLWFSAWNKRRGIQLLKLMEIILSNNLENYQIPPNNNSALHMSCKLNLTQQTKRLIKIGANINIDNINGLKPIHFAIKYESFDSFKLLLLNMRNEILSNNEIELLYEFVLSKCDTILVDYLSLLIKYGFEAPPKFQHITIIQNVQHIWKLERLFTFCELFLVGSTNINDKMLCGYDIKLKNNIYKRSTPKLFRSSNLFEPNLMYIIQKYL